MKNPRKLSRAQKTLPPDKAMAPLISWLNTESPDSVIHQMVFEIQALDRFDYPVAVKADGLAAGKGVIIARSRALQASQSRHTTIQFHGAPPWKRGIGWV